MTVFETSLPQNTAELVDFANYVFSHAHNPHDFPSLLSKAYGENAPLPADHYVAREDGLIKALVGVVPLNVRFGPCTLKYGLVGTVSVHPYARGRGYMKTLMNNMLNDQKSKGVDILSLSGQRQRYNYFGFERAGVRFIYSVNDTNVRHALAQVDTSDVSFKELTEGDASLLDFCYALHERQLLCAQRSREAFLTIMHTWKGKLYAALINGEPVGYVYCTTPDDIQELLLTQESHLPAILKKWIAQFAIRGVRLHSSPLSHERNAMLHTFMEEGRILCSDMIHIVNWENVLRACLVLKGMCLPLRDGRAVLEIKEEGRFEIIVKGGEIAVSKTEGAPNVSLDRLSATRYLFSPLEAFAPKDEAFENWLPLIHSLPNVDTF